MINKRTHTYLADLLGPRLLARLMYIQVSLVDGHPN